MRPRLLLPALCLLAGSAQAQFNSLVMWPVTPMAPTGRSGSYAFVLETTGYMGGGFTGQATTNDLWAFTPATQTWAPVAPLPGAGRTGAAAFVVNNLAYVVGGQRDSGSTTVPALADAWRYDPDIDAWDPIAPLPPTPTGGGRELAYAFSIGARGYVGGGRNGTHQYTDFWSYDPATDTWTALPAPPIALASGCTTFVLDGYGYVVGGFRADSLNRLPSRQVWRFDPATTQWTRRTDMPTPRQLGSSFTFVSQHHMAYVMGGIQDALSRWAADDVAYYDAYGDFWVSLGLPTAGGARTAPFCFSMGDNAYVGGGFELWGHQYTNSLWMTRSYVTGVPTASTPPAAFTLSPNPAHHAVRLLGAPAGPVQLLDALGRTVRAYAAPTATLDLAGLPPGLYTVRAGAAARRLVVE